MISAGVPPLRHILRRSEEKLPDVGCFCSGSLLEAPQLRRMFPSSSCGPLPDGWQVLQALEDWKRAHSCVEGEGECMEPDFYSWTSMPTTAEGKSSSDLAATTPVQIPHTDHITADKTKYECHQPVL